MNWFLAQNCPLLIRVFVIVLARFVGSRGFLEACVYCRIVLRSRDIGMASGFQFHIFGIS